MKYFIAQKLASGGMADVFLTVVENSAGQRKLAVLKTIREDVLASQPNVVEMMRDEMNVLLNLQHANIAQMITVIEYNNIPALLMEFVQGVTLSRFIEVFAEKRSPIPMQIAIFICAKLAEALNYIHDLKDPLTGKPLGIIHRDISPSNVLLGFSGDVKLTDFGIAKGNHRTEETVVGVIKGKLSYMSPEQFAGSDATVQSDIFSFGVMMFETITGNRIHELEHINSFNLIDSLDIIEKQVNKKLRTILEKCLYTDPTRRYASANLLVKDINGFMVEFSGLCTTNDLAQMIDVHLAEDKASVLEVVKKAFASNERDFDSDQIVTEKTNVTSGLSDNKLRRNSENATQNVQLMSEAFRIAVVETVKELRTVNDPKPDAFNIYRGKDLTLSNAKSSDLQLKKNPNLKSRMPKTIRPVQVQVQAAKGPKLGEIITMFLIVAAALTLVYMILEKKGLLKMFH